MKDQKPQLQGQKLIMGANWAMQEVDQIFSRFARYTRFVLFSKWFLIVFALGLVSALITVPLMTKDRSGIRVSFVDKGLSKPSASAPVMNNPEYRGTGESGSRYRVIGLRATQQTQDHIVIENVEAQMLTDKGAWRSLTALQADYDQTAKTILLRGEVTVMDEQGYSFVTPSATVDTATSEVTGAEPVEGVGPLGNVLASSFKIMNNGKHIIFNRGDRPVRLVVERKTRKA